MQLEVRGYAGTALLYDQTYTLNDTNSSFAWRSTTSA